MSRRVIADGAPGHLLVTWPVSASDPSLCGGGDGQESCPSPPQSNPLGSPRPTSDRLAGALPLAAPSSARSSAQAWSLAGHLAQLPAHPPIAGSETFGVTRERVFRHTKSGRAVLRELDDSDVPLLTPHETLLAACATGLEPCTVVQVRTALHGELGDDGVEVPVVDVAVRGRVLAFNPCDLLQVECRGQVRP